MNVNVKRPLQTRYHSACPRQNPKSAADAYRSAGSGAHGAGIVTAALAGALAAGAIVTGAMALGKKSDFDGQNRPDVAHATKEDLRSQANTLALVSTVLTGAALVGTGLSIYFWVKPSREPGVGQTESTSAGVVFASSF